MSRWLLLLPLLSACTTVGVVSEANDPYAGAVLRIDQPASGAFLPIEQANQFSASLTAPDGTPLATDGLDIQWSTSLDPTWVQDGASFTDDTLGIGRQDITAQVDLPDGDHVAYTAGGVLVQSSSAGIYTGLFQAQIGVQQVTANCAGTVTLTVDPTGQSGSGDATCVASLLGNSTQAHYTFDLTNSDGQVQGDAAIDLFGFTGLHFPAQGTLDPSGGTLDVTFDGGPASQFLSVSGSVQADRVSRDAGL